MRFGYIDGVNRSSAGQKDNVAGDRQSVGSITVGFGKRHRRHLLRSMRLFQVDNDQPPAVARGAGMTSRTRRASRAASAVTSRGARPTCCARAVDRSSRARDPDQRRSNPCHSPSASIEFELVPLWRTSARKIRSPAAPGRMRIRHVDRGQTCGRRFARFQYRREVALNPRTKGRA